MKLYHIPDAPHGQRWQPLKDKAQQLRREHGGDCEPVNIGEDGREQLADFLNNLERLASMQTELEVAAMATPVVAQVAAVVAKPANDEPRRGTPRTQDEIIDFILDEAEVYQVCNIMAALGTRFAEYLKEQRND